MSTPDPSSPAGVPVCYRHPDRETYIRCSHCERPICPDCMTSAPVGFQCPDCIAEARSSAPVIRSRLGAPVPTKPYVTYTIIALCVLGFGYQYLAGFDQVVVDYGMWPVGIAYNDQYYRLFTSMFLHGGLWHIGFNMLVLYSLGPALENLLGHVRYAVLYLVAGLGGSVASFWFSPPNVPSIGASGAIFGLFGAWVVIGRRLNVDVRQVIGLIVLNVVLGFVFPGVDWRAHLGGLVTGAIVAAVLVYAPQRNKVAWESVGVVAVVAVLALLVQARDSQLDREIAAQLIQQAQAADSSAWAPPPPGTAAVTVH